MKPKKELVTLYEGYRSHTGNQQPDAAALLTLAHILIDVGREINQIVNLMANVNIKVEGESEDVPG